MKTCNRERIVTPSRASRPTLQALAVTVAAAMAVVFLIGAASTAALALDSSRYRWQSPIAGKTGDLSDSNCGKAGGYVTFNVTPEIYDRSLSDLSDIRIVTDDGREIPFVIWTERAEKTSHRIVSDIINTAYVPQSHTTFTIDLGDEYVRTNAVTVTTSSVDFVRRVTVEGSPDNRHFAVLTNDIQIFDFTTDHGVADTTVSYPTTDYRYIRVTLWDNGDTPLSDVGGSVSIRESVKGERVPLNIRKIETTTDDTTTHILVDLGYRHIPSNAVEFEAGDATFSREVTIRASNDPPARDTFSDDDSFRVVSSGVIHRITTESFKTERLTLEYPETKERYLEFIIHDRDDAPLDMTVSNITGVPRHVTFAVKEGESYFLLTGNVRAHTPSYDLRTTFPFLDKSTFSPCEAGALRENPYYVPSREIPYSERYRMLIWVALGLAALVLGIVVIRAMRRTVRSK
ncbi:MAG: DUF3999 family protein [Deltaproteobacteria bacterium]|nr:DUF3999 family protein [Candidatus Zymogenaceae bacterium]